MEIRLDSGEVLLYLLHTYTRHSNVFYYYVWQSEIRKASSTCYTKQYLYKKNCYSLVYFYRVLGIQSICLQCNRIAVVNHQAVYQYAMASCYY